MDCVKFSRLGPRFIPPFLQLLICSWWRLLLVDTRENCCKLDSPSRFGVRHMGRGGSHIEGRRVWSHSRRNVLFPLGRARKHVCIR